MEQEKVNIMQCPYCGEDININAKKCKHCGEWLEEKPASQSASTTQVVVNQVENKSNGFGIAGFVLSILGTFFCWAPGVNMVLWFLGLLFSAVGMSRKPRGLAIAGLVISIIDIIIIIAVFGTVMAIFASL